MPENRTCNKLPSKFREAVCIDTNRVYDSCADKDCLADLRVYFGNGAQSVIDDAVSVRIRSAEVLNCVIDVEKTPFNRGCYTCDITFFFKVKLDAYTQGSQNPTTVCGFTTFSTFMDENAAFLRSGHTAMIALYVAASLAVGFAAALLGHHLTRP